MASLTRCTWVWVNSRSWWCTGRPGMLQFMGLQRVGHDWVTELNWNCGGGNEDNGDLLQRSHASTATLSAPDPAAGCCQPSRLPETPGHSWASLAQSLVGSLLLFPGSWCIRFCLCLQWLYFPALCKFWQFYGGVNGDLLQDGLCHTTSAAPRTPAPVAVHCWPVPPQEMLRHSSISVSVGSQRFKTL